MFLFNSALKRRVQAARKELHERLENIRRLLSQDDLDDSLRVELEGKEAKIRAHLETRVKQINGGP